MNINISLKIFLMLLLLIQIILIIKTVQKRKLSMKYGSFWIIFILLMFIIVIYPKILFEISSLFGFEVTSNMIFIMGFFFLYYLVFFLTTSISIQNEKIKSLVQEISMLKKMVDNNEK